MQKASNKLIEPSLHEKTPRGVTYICLLLFLISGCAGPVYFPLRRDEFFKTKSATAKAVEILPFRTRINTYFSKFNTYEKLKEKSEQAEDYFIQALRIALNEKGYNVVGHISMKDIDEDKIDKEILTLLNELYTEFDSASYSFHKNLDKEKEKPFDYSIGIRTIELCNKLNDKPDIFIMLDPQGFVANLSRMDDTILSNTEKALEAIFTLGLSSLNPTPEDVIYIGIAFINAENGNILWYDKQYFYSRSVLLAEHVKECVKKLLKEFPSRP